MNVLIMADFPAKCSGNFINSLLHLAGKMKEKKWTPIFMFPLLEDGTEREWVEYIRNYDASVEGGNRVIMFDRALPNDELADLLFRIVEKYKIDLIHSHFSCCDQVLLWNKELHSKVKILYHDHMDYVAELPLKLQLKKQIKVAKRYWEYGIGIISVMKKKHWGYFLAPKKWFIPNGISFKRNVEHSMSREECRAMLGLKDTDVLCLFLGWDIYRKGLDIAVNAVQEARKTNPNVILGIIGFEENPSDETIRRIRKIVGFDPRQEGIRFMNSMEDMFALHRAADVYLSASRTEAFSYGILEAVSQNVPVVVSDINGTKWSWKYSKCVKFKNEDTQACAKAILTALPKRFDVSNSEMITQKYSIDTWCERVLRVYQKMIR